VSDQPEFDGRAFALSLSSGPGVYVMRDARGKVLYVGKARNLKRRVASYFDGRDKGARINLMVRRIGLIEVSLTRTEAEALLLENEWIKAHRPHFNINLRDDKSYPWIRLESAHAFPRIGFYRGTRRPSGEYFGPYSSAGAVRESLNQIYRLLGLRQCRDSVFHNRSRPCLQYQINRCTAPCVGYISKDDYARDVEAAVQLLQGRDDAVVRRLGVRMQQASETLDFEQAARYRDQIQALQRVRAGQFVTDATGNLDVVGLAMRGDRAALQVVEFRHGNNLGGRCFFPANLPPEPRVGEVLSAFIGQYYAERRPPAEILLPAAPDQADLWTQALSDRRAARVRIRWRLRGDRAHRLKLAQTNAEDALRRHLAGQNQIGLGLTALAELIGLPAPPTHLECFDVSHSSGAQPVASCVVFGNEGARRKRYRLYNIEAVGPGDDYAAMEQVLRRRYRRALEQADELPDLIVIDGGLGQVNRALEVLDGLGLDGVPVLGVAKGPGRKAGYETLVFDRRKVQPGPRHAASHLIQQIRDEAHRFAITAHRRRRQKESHRSPLEQIPGIGPKRRRDLLQHFGGLQGLRRAGTDELARVPGISHELAVRIAEHLRG